MKGIYNIDSSSSIHKSHENKEVQQLYHYMLDGELSSETSEKLFHTSYAPRGSTREKLMQFLYVLSIMKMLKEHQVCVQMMLYRIHVQSFIQGCDKVFNSREAAEDHKKPWSRISSASSCISLVYDGLIKSLTRN